MNEPDFGSVTPPYQIEMVLLCGHPIDVQCHLGSDFSIEKTNDEHLCIGCKFNLHKADLRALLRVQRVLNKIQGELNRLVMLQLDPDSATEELYFEKEEE